MVPGISFCVIFFSLPFVNLRTSQSHIPNSPCRSMSIQTMQTTMTTITTMATTVTLTMCRCQILQIDLPHRAPKYSAVYAASFRPLPQKFSRNPCLFHFPNSVPLASLILYECCMQSNSISTKPFLSLFNMLAGSSYLRRLKKHS
jgi:hypothetical protein